MSFPSASVADEFFNKKSTESSGSSSDGSLINKVYLGSSKTEATTTVSPTGVTYQIPAGRKDEVQSITDAKRRYLNDPKLQASWVSLLSKNGFETDPLSARALWDMSVDGASDWFATSNGEQKITPQQYLTWYSKGQKKKPSIPTRQIYQVPEAEIDADIDAIAQRRLGRTLNDADKTEDWYANLVKGINKMYAKGTVTSVQEVVNPKTGKKEKQVIQSPKFSKEKIAETTTAALEAADPEAVERMARLNFAKRYGIGG